LIRTQIAAPIYSYPHMIERAFNRTFEKLVGTPATWRRQHKVATKVI
jgi:hypothetical protein